MDVGENAVVAPAFSLPAVTDVCPLYVLTPLSKSVPGPCLSKPNTVTIGALIVAVSATFVTVMIEPPCKFSGAARLPATV